MGGLDSGEYDKRFYGELTGIYKILDIYKNYIDF